NPRKQCVTFPSYTFDWINRCIGYNIRNNHLEKALERFTKWDLHNSSQ
ncbi:hypothetical protein chiPu_0027999, partial [Chiloscyllium punctatum]|nr:hypothetical protein [Chiloscyllium punctatum]